MNYEIEYFHPSIKADINGWPKSIKADFRKISLLLVEYGPQVRMPHTKAMGDGLFEMRPQGRDGIGRVFYCYVKGKKIIILHSFIKKTQKTPQKELQLARKRLQEVQ
ncbi:MAG: type II toxin-antitoxin system RelE/ParE family toxin [Chlorobaculum sp.]|nr:type II toxin-antitoxin system RelE/ParE family toxin [Chlorobaculum sp.]